MTPETPRSKPFYLEPNCPDCDALLVLEKDCRSYDEWTCPDQTCESSGGVYMDWPPEEIEKIFDAAEESASWEDEDLPFASEQEFKEKLGIDPKLKVSVARVSLTRKSNTRGDC